MFNTYCEQCGCTVGETEISNCDDVACPCPVIDHESLLDTEDGHVFGYEEDLE